MAYKGPDGITVIRLEGVSILRMESSDGYNRLRLNKVHTLTAEVETLASVASPLPLVIKGNEHFFSAGADINAIAALHGAEAYDFAHAGQRLMNAVDHFPAPVIASINGYCMGGGLDLALACDFRICSPKSIFGHRGAALGIMTGWGGTQRLPRLIGKARALQMFLASEKIGAEEALKIGLVDEISPRPTATAQEWARTKLLDSPLFRNA
jgi:enoyl-CoA hydratase/carnithine racemase